MAQTNTYGKSLVDQRSPLATVDRVASDQPERRHVDYGSITHSKTHA